MSVAVIRKLSSAADSAEFVVVTVLTVSGSAPGHAGADLLARSDHSFTGTVGGGQVERAALVAVETVLRSRRSSILNVSMLGAETEGSQMICGGVSTMLVEYVSGSALVPYRAAAERLSDGRRAIIAKYFPKKPQEGETEVLTAAFSEDGAFLAGEKLPPRAVEALIRAGSEKNAFLEKEGLFLEPVAPEEKLLVLGAGHVGAALAAAALPLGFSVFVADERPEFVQPSRLPPGVSALPGPYVETIEAFPFDSDTYVVIVTPGHLNDLECARAVLRRDYRYAGLIGSSRKVRMMLEQLESDGIPRDKLVDFCAPIGLDIGSETPAEIAVSIAAELVCRRRGGAAVRDRSSFRRP